MYFPHSFEKWFPAKKDAISGDIVFSTTASIDTLAAGEIALYDPYNSWNVINNFSPGTNKPFVLAMGSYFQNDKIAPLLGGYQEPVKTKIINPRYVSRFIKFEAKAAQNQILSVGWDLDTTMASNNMNLFFECGKTYRLQVNALGSPVLRFLNHNLYRTFEAYTGCCTDDCSSACTGEQVDPVVVLLKWKEQINTYPLFVPFIRASVWINDGGVLTEVTDTSTTYTPSANPDQVIAGLKLEVAYADTRYSNCVFSSIDHYELQPLKILVSLVDETGDPCITKQIINTSTGTGVTEIQAGLQAVGVGETVLRNYLTAEGYRQNIFPESDRVDSLRMREREGSNALSAIDRASLYDIYMILHTVPAKYNPTSIADSDQYAVYISVPQNTNGVAFENAVQGLLDDAASGIQLEIGVYTV